jgi:homospermidine synthase
MVVRHEEAYSISKWLTTEKKDYRPTVHYAYWPCIDSISSLYESQAAGNKMLPHERVLRHDIISGSDELGVFMMSRDFGCWWTGSILDNASAKKIDSYQTATIMQVASSVYAAICYAFDHPNEGVIHPEEMDAVEVMDKIMPYLGKFVSQPVDWQPTVDKGFAKEKNWIIQKLLVK